MGDPRKQRRKYERPKHPWRAERILEENELCKKYGLKNKTELWRAKSTIGRFRQQARQLLGSSGEKIEAEKKGLVERLNKLGLLESNKIEDILSLTVENLLERRLQTIVQKKGLTTTIKQSRQYVTHGHVIVGSNIVDTPSYIVSHGEEDQVKLTEKMEMLRHG